MTIQEKFLNELHTRIRKNQTIRIFVTPSERQGMSSISLMNSKMFNRFLKIKKS